MALKFRKSLSEPVKFVWDQDPALDTKSKGFAKKWAAFLQTGDAKDLEPCLREGMRPAIFDVKPLSRRAWLSMQKEQTGLEMAVWCVAFGLKAVHNVDVDGVKFELGKADFDCDGPDEFVKLETLDKIWDPTLFAALGHYIMEKSRLDPTRGQV